MASRFGERTRVGEAVSGLGRRVQPLKGFPAPSGYNTTNLRQWFDAGVVASYPGTGTTVTDLSGNNNHGTLVNGVTWTYSDTPSFNLDGTDDYIASTGETVPNAGPNTYDMWVNLSPGFDGYFFGMAGPDTHGAQSGYCSDDGNYIYSAAWGGGGNPLSYTYTVSNPGWINLTFTYHSSATPKRAIYLDGTLVASSSGFEGSSGGGIAVPWGTVRYNTGSYDTSFTLNGKFGMMARYTRILSGAEITSNFNAYKSRFGR